jgi:DNA-binding MarR family transcriptional regulator
MNLVQGLRADEERAWQAFLLGTQLLMDQLDRDLQHDARMPRAYYAILVALSEQPDRALRMTELAEWLCFSKSRLTHAVGRLEERGWVERAVCPTDRRGAFAVLTAEGLAALEAATPRHVECVRRLLFDRLSPDQVEQLRAIGEAIARPLLSAEVPPACTARQPEPAGRPNSRDEDLSHTDH